MNLKLPEEYAKRLSRKCHPLTDAYTLACLHLYVSSIKPRKFFV